MLSEEEKAKKREKYKAKQSKWNKIFWIGFILFWFLIFFGWFLWGIIGVNIDYSSGERVGRIIKFSEKGLIWKTWEMEMVMAQDGGFMTTYVWEFSVDRYDVNQANLTQELYDAFYYGSLVRVKYEQKAGHVPWRGDTSYFVKEVTPVN